MKKLIISFAVVTLLSGITTVALAGHSSHEDEPKITICHATASQSNPYVQQNIDQNSILSGGHGHSGVNEGDIIPPFGDYAGNNWDAEHQAIYNNDCNVPCEIVILPVIGCTDSNAINFNPLATQNDESCVYPPPVIEPPVVPPDVPPVIIPPDNPPVPPVVEPPSETPEPPTQSSIPPQAPQSPTTSGGGGGGSCYQNCQIDQVINIVNQPNQASQPQTTQDLCVPITNFIVDVGKTGDGVVKLIWKGGNDNKIVVFGTNKDLLSEVKITNSNNGIELSGLKKVNYWFAVSNPCSATPLIDPIP